MLYSRKDGFNSRRMKRSHEGFLVLEIDCVWNSIQYSVMTYMGIEPKKRVHICVYVTDSLCCTSETNTAL